MSMISAASLGSVTVGSVGSKALEAPAGDAAEVVDARVCLVALQVAASAWADMRAIAALIAACACVVDDPVELV
jgi:hypothetical protein